ncbi:MAG: peptidylprolyl isomerase [Candidatus Aenigmarchaeota archaeon]|nr:peptidylprolyl isomerase [Candidatus Aenigmarchaeota archaeon]NIP40691.1 peptidylprolyl isomerase [Candidatus Aenigmarchaeota archaeon]NIQ18497.1 peptidylprolyl isomerase [Candidatus Aenigmarchaeota archaeon]NIS73396.1 peptidylprolyl isomerase [Candidatus Aenigmarchaeota archaeon]
MKQGEFIEIEYVGRVKLTNEIFDLTSEELAKKENIYNPKHTYGPALVIVGSNMVIRGVMKEIEKMEVGEERQFEVSPGEGFGMRNPKMIRVLPISKFIENKINPVPGGYFEIDGMQAKVQSVSGGRVRVDFNNPLAGKDLVYRLKIVRRVEGNKNKVGKLLSYYRIGYSEVRIKERSLVIVSEKPVNPVAKRMVTEMATKWIKVKKIEFKEKGAGTKKNQGLNKV